MRDAAVRCEGKYQLRYAAGLHWLIDMEQDGGAYVEPVPLNDSGAQLWKLLDSGMTATQISQWLCREYGLSPEEAMADVQTFVAQLQARRIDLEGVQ